MINLINYWYLEIHQILNIPNLAFKQCRPVSSRGGGRAIVPR